MSGKIYVVGIGPGNKEHLTFRAYECLKNSTAIVGYKTYLELIPELVEGKTVFSSGMKKEVDRCNETIRLASNGHTVSLVSSGDAGIYGMAGILLEILNRQKHSIDVEIVPGVSSVNACASLLGAPLMHDFACISLSDLLTDWKLIRKRIESAAVSDFVIALYNPKSKSRIRQLEECRELILQYRSGNTPVGIVTDALRNGQKVIFSTLNEVLMQEIGMTTTVIVGNSQTFISNGCMITPRGYRL